MCVVIYLGGSEKVWRFCVVVFRFLFLGVFGIFWDCLIVLGREEDVFGIVCVLGY